MGSADSIEPILLQPRNPISPELIRDSNPDSGVVQMHIRAAQLDSLTIEQQPLLRRELERPNTEPLRHNIRQFAIIEKPDCQCIKIWRVNAPATFRPLYSPTFRITDFDFTSDLIPVYSGVRQNIVEANAGFIHIHVRCPVRNSPNGPVRLFLADFQRIMFH